MLVFPNSKLIWLAEFLFVCKTCWKTLESWSLVLEVNDEFRDPPYTIDCIPRYTKLLTVEYYETENYYSTELKKKCWLYFF